MSGQVSVPICILAIDLTKTLIEPYSWFSFFKKQVKVFMDKSQNTMKVIIMLHLVLCSRQSSCEPANL